VTHAALEAARGRWEEAELAARERALAAHLLVGVIEQVPHPELEAQLEVCADPRPPAHAEVADGEGRELRELVAQIVREMAAADHAGLGGELDPVGQREAHARVAAVQRRDRQPLAVETRDRVVLDLAVIERVVGVELEPGQGTS
jgi:hypothetical protein